MLKALQLIFEPSTAWDTIVQAKRNVWQIAFLYLIPTILIACALEAWGLHALGNKPAMAGFAERAAQPVAQSTIIRYEIAQAVLMLASVFVLALLLRVLMKTLHCKATYTEVFTAITYSFAPLFLMIAADGLPAINPWLCRGIGAILAAKVFYVGLVRVIKPEPTSALGIYLIASFLIFAFAGLTQFVILQVLENGLFRVIGS
jgi:hypothetical protein